MDVADLKSRLNNCSAPQYTEITDLSPGIPHRVIQFSKSHTRYGEAVCAILEGPNDEDDVFLSVYLPTRFLRVLDDVMMNNYNNSDDKKISLMYDWIGKGMKFV